MTPEELSTFFMQHGYHLKAKSYILSKGDTKYKLAKNSLQKFAKSGTNWIKIWSVYYKDISFNPETQKLHVEKYIY